MASIQGIYIALFGRPADPIGLQYWNGVTNNGADLSRIVDLASTPEYQDRFAGMNNTQIVNSIYQSLFGRDADLAGLTFFVNGLQNGTYNINNIAISILDAAQGSDAEILANKEAAANAFTASIDTTAEVLAYSGNDAAQDGRDFLAGITADEATVPTQVEVDAAIEAIVDGGSEGPNGDTFTLTEELDQFTGTAANDTFQGDIADLEGFDDINGGAGNDTLNLYVEEAVDGTDVDIDSTVDVQNVENINFLYEDELDAEGSINASAFEGAERINQVNSAVAVTAVAAGVTIAFEDALVEAEDVIEFSGETGSVELDNVDTGSVVTVEGEDLTTLNVSGSVAADEVDGEEVAGTLSIAADLADDVAEDEDYEPALTTVNLALTSDVNLQTGGEGSANVTTLNASASTGGITLDTADGGDASLALETVSFGSGDDSVTVGLSEFAAEDVTISLGAGDNTLVLTNTAQSDETADDDAPAATSLTIELGAGTDELTFGTLSNLVVDDEEETLDGIISVEGFDGDDDFATFNVSGAEYTVTNLDEDALEEAETLYDAVEYIAGRVDGVEDGYAVFQFEGSTYVYNETGTGEDAASGLVELVDFTGTLGGANSDFNEVELVGGASDTDALPLG